MIIPLAIPSRMMVQRIVVKTLGRGIEPDKMLLIQELNYPIVMPEGEVTILEVVGEMIPIEPKCKPVRS